MGEGTVSRFLGGEPSAATPGPGATKAVAVKPTDASPIIASLQTRQTALIPGTPYARVAEAVMASSSRVAEAELRVAQLRAEAAKKNWLPKIGPRISLNSLGELIADLVLQQVLFDNGRKRAERDLAKANVEIAAVAIVEDSNTRVYEALSRYLRAEQGRELQKHLGTALDDMQHFQWVMNERVKGGVSDMSDLNVLNQKLANIRARSGEARESVTTALAELSAMSDRSLEALRGLGDLGPRSANEALGVIRATAERDRALAEARIARASHLPGLSATGSVGDSGDNYGLEVTTDQLFGLGTMAEFKAIEATKEIAERRIAEAREDAAREIQSQSRQLEAYQRQAAEARTLTVQAKQNLDLFQRQYEGGQRQVMDVVGVYETYAAATEKEIELKYKAARAALELARLRGALAEGARI